MILVTLGTQKQPFPRLLDYIEKANIKDEIIVQSGPVEYKNKNMKFIGLVDMDEYDKLIDKSDFVIAHGGTGSVISALKKQKKIIACARITKYHEAVDDHQEELVSNFASEGYLLELTDENNLADLVKELKRFKPKKFKSNQKKFIEKLINTLK